MLAAGLPDFSAVIGNCSAVGNLILTFTELKYRNVFYLSFFLLILQTDFIVRSLIFFIGESLAG